MRISVAKDDKRQREYTQLVASGRQAVIRLDGVEQTKVITADTSDGFIERFVTNEVGHLVRDPSRERALTERLAGKVEIEFVEAMGPLENP